MVRASNAQIRSNIAKKSTTLMQHSKSKPLPSRSKLPLPKNTSKEVGALSFYSKQGQDGASKHNSSKIADGATTSSKDSTSARSPRSAAPRKCQNASSASVAALPPKLTSHPTSIAAKIATRRQSLRIAGATAQAQAGRAVLANASGNASKTSVDKAQTKVPNAHPPASTVHNSTVSTPAPKPPPAELKPAPSIAKKARKVNKTQRETRCGAVKTRPGRRLNGYPTIFELFL